MNWDGHTDVAVVGSGFAGLAAAIEAHTADAETIIIEKQASLGGNSKMSGGAVAGVHTQKQTDEGVEDTVDLFVDDLLDAGGKLNHPELVRYIAENSAQNIDWLTEQFNIEFEEPLYHLGGHSVPRSYYPTGEIGGIQVVRKMVSKVKEFGIPIQRNQKLESIITRGDRVTGITVLDGFDPINETSETLKRIRIRDGLVMATGGFASDMGMKTSQNPRLESSRTTNHPFATGEALKESIQTGANPLHLSFIQLLPTTSPDDKAGGTGIGNSFVIHTALNAVWIDPSTGRRFVNELGDRRTRAMAELDLGKAPEYPLAIVDRRTATQFDHLETALDIGSVHEMDSLRSIAEQFGVPEAALSGEIDAYNDYVDEGHDPDFGKPFSGHARRLENPPWYVVRLWPRSHYTMGGLEITRRAEVVDMNGRVIPDFYAAGEVTGGIHGMSRLTSCSISDCLCFGREAGARAAGATSPYE